MHTGHPHCGRHFRRAVPFWSRHAPGDSHCFEATDLKQIPSTQFFAHLNRDSLWQSFVRYLVVRIADQQQSSPIVMVNIEQRLGQTLLQLARTLGKKDPRSIRIELKITHEELSEMVGATRPRNSMFMQRFHHLGLIETTRDHFLIVKENKLTNLEQSLEAGRHNNRGSASRC